MRTTVLPLLFLFSACAVQTPAEGLLDATMIATETSKDPSSLAGVELQLLNTTNGPICLPIHAVVGPLFDKSLLEVTGPEGRVEISDTFSILRPETAEAALVVFPGERYVGGAAISDVYPLDRARTYRVKLSLFPYRCSELGQMRSVYDANRGKEGKEVELQAEIGPLRAMNSEATGVKSEGQYKKPGNGDTQK